jgi:prevent-host-death family protein
LRVSDSELKEFFVRKMDVSHVTHNPQAICGCRQEPVGVSLDVRLETAMPKVPDIIPVTDLRQDAAGALERVRSSRQPLVITQRGRAAAVILSIEAYESAEHERQLLHLLARGDKEIASGDGYDLDAVLKEADALLARLGK